jgi:predicted Zn-dependent protease
MRLAELYADAHRYQEAADAYAAAQSALGGRADLTPQRASALLNAGKPAAARDLLQKSLATRADGRDAALLYLLGQAQRQLKDVTAASVTARKLTAAFPDDERGLYLRAQLLADAGQANDALAAYRDLIKRAPDNQSIVYEYADLLEKSGRPEEAERALRDVLSKARRGG